MAVRVDEIHDQGAVDLDRDRALVLRYQRGDHDAFDELFRRYYPRLHLYCQRRTGDPHVAEELAQEAFLRALRAMPRFAGERRFYPWMTVIAQRLCIDHHRRSARVELSPDVDLGAVEPDHDALFAAVDHRHLDEAMARLAPRHREALDLREQQGWSYQRIAEHLDVPITTVEALLHRARKALKREFLAVSSGSRIAGVPIVGWVVARVARVRARLSASNGVEHLLPLAGSAAAGLAAIGLVLAPLAPSSPVNTDRSHAVQTAAAPTPTSFAIVGSAPEPDSAAWADDAPAQSTKPKPAADLGVAEVYRGPEGTRYAEQSNEEQPVVVDLGVIQAGLNPKQLVGDAVNALPGGNP